MDRVKGTAKLVGVSDNLYDMWKGYDESIKGVKGVINTGVSIAHNGAWMYGKLRSGYTVIDIGMSTEHARRGVWYATERFVLDVWQCRNVLKFPLNYYF